MKVMSQFKSSYGLALYENVIRYQNLSFTPWFDLSVFRKLMGVDDSKYPIFRDFKRRVLDKAVYEVNAIASIEIEADLQKQRRKVTALRFKIIKNSIKVNPSKRAEAEPAVMSRLKQDFGLSDSQISNVTENYAENYILEKIGIIEASKSYRSGKIFNLSKYLMNALADNYQKPKNSKVLMKMAYSENMIKEQKIKNREKQAEALKKAHSVYLSDHLKIQFDTLTDDAKARVLSGFEKKIHSLTLINRLYLKEGIANTIVFMEFKHFVKNEFPELLATALSLEDFSANFKDT